MIRRAVRIIAVGLGAITALSLAGAAALWFAVDDISDRLDEVPIAAVWSDSMGEPLLVRSAEDGQIRLPYSRATGNAWLELAVIAAEDRRFRDHSGVDLRAVLRAAWANLRAMRTVEGASGLAMQTAKLVDPQPRTFRTKAIEATRALKLVRSVGHDRVVESYLTLAPFGGNRVGAEAAALAYFGRPTSALTLAECALLAGLPKSPERLRPDRHPEAAARRRDETLRRMHREGMIDDALLAAALAEPIRIRSEAFVPRHRATALWAASRRPTGGTTTIDPVLQGVAESLARRCAAEHGSGIEAAIVVIEIETASMMALAVSSDPDDPSHGWVPLFASWRSPGSALKPLVYAAAFERDLLAPSAVLADREHDLGSWRPRNFDRSQRGTTTVADALRDSLNLPAIATLGAVGVAETAALMERSGVRFRGDAPHRAELSLAVGGAEVRLIDLTNAMATIGRGGLHREPKLFAQSGHESPHDGPRDRPATRALSSRTAAALDWILSTHDRAPAGLESTPAHERPWLMWKTGTSSGHRDAWSVGHNGRVAVGIWIGRPAGGGDPQLVGALAAEPAMVQLLASEALRPVVAHRAERTDWTPRVASALTTPRPLRRVAAPRGGAEYVAIDGSAEIAVRLDAAPTTESGHWLLDGRPLPTPPRRLSLAPGRYELTHIDDDGDAETVRFTVR